MRRCSQMFIALTSERSNALLHGDLSGLVLHPVLVPIATLIGFVAWQEETTLYDASREDVYFAAADVALELLLQEEGILTVDVLTVQIQAHAWLAFYHFWRSYPPQGFRLLQKAIATSARLGFLDSIFTEPTKQPAMGPTQSVCYNEARDDREERIAAFCQLVHHDYDSRSMLASSGIMSNKDINLFLALKVRIITKLLAEH